MKQREDLYQKTNGVPYTESRALKWAFFWVTHRRVIFRGLLIAFIIFDCVLIGNVSLQAIKLWIGNQKQDDLYQQLTINTIDWAKIHQANKPLDLMVSDLLTSQNNNECDFAAEVENPNVKWAVSSLKYRFVWNGGQTEIGENLILPLETKHILLLKQKIGLCPSSFDLKWENISWSRIAAKNSLVDFSLSQIEISEKQFFVKQGIVPAKLVFQIFNNSPFGLRNLYFNLILFQRSVPVDMEHFGIENLPAGEKRTMEKIFSRNDFWVSKIILEPEVNIFASDILMPVMGQK